MITTTAPAKIILFGEHAVVYGEPAIAVPLADLRAIATMTASDAPLHIIAQDLSNQTIHIDDDDPLAQITRAALKGLGQAIPHARLELQSKIPIASGLGSGAAISTVIVRALAAFNQHALNHDETNRIVYDIEKLHHGTPSGIDNTVIVYEQAIYYVRNQPIQHIANRTPFTILVANTGIGAPTKIAVSDVRRLYNTKPERTKPVIERIGQIAHSAHQAMQAGDLPTLGELMYENHHLLRQLTVSSHELDILVETARANGALGAKLSGGGRGGNMIALVKRDDSQRMTDALYAAGATNVLQTKIEST